MTKCKSEDKDEIIRIKALRIRPKSKKYVIETDFEADEEYVLDEDVIIKYQIFKDKEYSLKEFKKILKEIEISKLFNKTLNYLSYGPRSKHEIYAYMDKQNKDKLFSQNDLISIVGRLKDLGYVDDLMYSNNIVDYYMNTKGIDYIRNFLKGKLVEEDIIEKAILKYDDDLEIEVAYKIGEKYSNQNRKYPLKKQQILLTQKLYRDGFSSSTINKVVNKIDFIDESSDTLEKDILKQIKKYEKKDISTYEKKQKIIASLMNKGYSYTSIIEKLKL